MELRLEPRRTTPMSRLWLAVAAIVLAPVVLFVVAPAVLGLHRYVVTADVTGGVQRGSLVFATDAAATALRPGDVITFRPPSGSELVTRRVRSVSLDGVRTESPAGADPWVLPVTGDVDRMVVQVPLVGYPFLGLTAQAWLVLAAVPAAAVLLALLGDLLRRRRRPLSFSHGS